MPLSVHLASDLSVGIFSLSDRIVIFQCNLRRGKFCDDRSLWYAFSFPSVPSERFFPPETLFLHFLDRLLCQWSGFMTFFDSKEATLFDWDFRLLIWTKKQQNSCGLAYPSKVKSFPTVRKSRRSKKRLTSSITAPNTTTGTNLTGTVAILKHSRQPITAKKIPIHLNL